MTVLLPSQVFRIAAEEHSRTPEDALSGIGGEKAGGRWHTKGRRIVYTASSRALCMLERVVHGDEWLTELKSSRRFLAIDVGPVSWTHYTASDLDAIDPLWRQEGSRLCRELGDVWLARKSTYGLLVPSAVLPYEYNFLLNPAHPDQRVMLANVSAWTPEAVQIDPRLPKIVRIAPAS